MVTRKYQDALPLYRQAALVGRFGGDLSRNTLAASVVRVGEAVQPIINLLRDHLLDADLIYGDETTVQVLKEPGRAAQTKSYLWAQMNGTGALVRLFSYCPSRSTATAAALYAGIKPGAVLMTEARQRLREAHSRPVLAAIEDLLLRQLHTVLPQSLFGKALHYLHGQWPKLIRYLDNGAWPISNNPCENALRPFVVGVIVGQLLGKLCSLRPTKARAGRGFSPHCCRQTCDKM